MLKVDTTCMDSQARQMEQIARELDRIASRVAAVNRTLRWNTSVDYAIRKNLTGYSNTVSNFDNKAKQLAQALNSAASWYNRAEKDAKPSGDTGIAKDGFEKIHAIPVGPEGKNPWYQEEFWKEFQRNFGWDEALAGAGDIGELYDLIKEMRDGKTWKDFGKAGVSLYQFFSGAVTKFNNYMKIGNAVGTKTALSWWAKSVTGFKALGRASTAKNPFTRFANNLTNKTSPFNAQFKNVVNNFTGKNGVGKAAASWGAVAVNGVMNFFSNKDEQAASNGTMSNGRVVAETITETAVDTALTYGAGIVVGAAVTAAFGTVAAPGIVVVAASGAVIAGINAGVKALTGETVTEWVSDGILDTAEKIGDAAKNVGKAIGKWFGKLSFA